VLLVSQAVGLVLVGGFVTIRGEGPPDGQFLLYAALGGVAGTAGIAAFYRGLAVGAMGVVAPISGIAAAIPVSVGVASGERPSGLQVAGIALALVGVALASREEEPAPAGPEGAPPDTTPAAPRAPSRRPRARVAGGVGLALTSAVGFGVFFVFIDQASEGDAAWAILASRLVGLSIVVTLAASLRPAPMPRRTDVPALIAVGAFDMMGQSLFAVASTEGLLSVVAVLSSLYPVVTIMLARLVLGERVRALQRAGAVGALAGVALITGG
jgi:drug/metabolite transporter (DMT)-like permease